MKKTKKKLLGLLGLFVVAATTTFAALMPLPGASAILGPTTVTDDIQVRVVGDKPLVTFTSPESGTVFKDPNATISLNYENIKNLTVKITHTDMDGVEHTYTLANGEDKDYNPGSWQQTLNLNTYGPGRYLVKATGSHEYVDNIAEDLIEFYYKSTPSGNGGVTQDEEGNVIVDPGVDPEEEDIYKVEVDVYKGDYRNGGELLDELSHVEVPSPYEPFELPFADHDLPSGRYDVVVNVYRNADVVEQYIYTFYYEAEEIPVPSAGAPNTGGFLGNLNISRSDYLITGLLVFGLAAVIGLFFVMKNRQQKSKSKTKSRH